MVSALTLWPRALPERFADSVLRAGSILPSGPAFFV